MIALPNDVSRCLAHGNKVGEWCEKRHQCARHESIKTDRTAVPTIYRACDFTGNFLLHIPLEGFSKTEEA